MKWQNITTIIERPSETVTLPLFPNIPNAGHKIPIRRSKAFGITSIDI